MSTKIYNGYQLNPSIGSLTDLSQISSKLHAFAEETLIPLATGLLAKQIAIAAYEAMDAAAIERYSAGKRDSIGIDISDAIERATFGIHHKIDTSVERGIREPSVDMRATLMIFSIRDKTLALLFADNPDLIKAIDASGFLTEYAYWNNTDAPDDITEQAWERRKEDWDLALGASGIPSMNGYQIPLIKEGFFPPLTDKEILLASPTMDERVEPLLNDAIFAKAHSLMTEDEVMLAKRGQFRPVMNALNRFKLCSDYEEFVNKTRQEIIDAISALDVNRTCVAPSRNL